VFRLDKPKYNSAGEVNRIEGLEPIPKGKLPCIANELLVRAYERHHLDVTSRLSLHDR
jgi:hypothetical protein